MGRGDDHTNGNRQFPEFGTHSPLSPQVQLLESLDVTPYIDTSEERTHFAFGAGDAWGAKARVIAVKPRGEHVEITAVAEDVRVHEANLAA